MKTFREHLNENIPALVVKEWNDNYQAHLDPIQDFYWVLRIQDNRIVVTNDMDYEYPVFNEYGVSYENKDYSPKYTAKTMPTNVRGYLEQHHAELYELQQALKDDVNVDDITRLIDNI